MAPMAARTLRQADLRCVVCTQSRTMMHESDTGSEGEKSEGPEQRGKKTWWGRLRYARCFTHPVPGVPETFWPFSTLPSGGRPRLFAVARDLP